MSKNFSANIEPFSRAYDILSNLTKKQAPVSEDPPGDILYLCKSLQNEIIDLSKQKILLKYNFSLF